MIALALLPMLAIICVAFGAGDWFRRDLARMERHERTLENIARLERELGL